MNGFLKYNGYHASVPFSSEDGVIFGKVLGIDEMISFEGSSLQKCKKAFGEAVDDYIDTCKILKKLPLQKK